MAAWNAAFKPVQGQVESIGCIARGKAAHQPMGEKKCAIAVPLGHSYRRSSSSLIASTTHGPAPRNLRVPSAPALQASALLSSSPGASPTPSPNLGPKRPDYLAPTDFTTATMLGGGHVDRTSRAPSPNSQTPLAFTTPTSSHGASLVHGLVKKKPPPPPPKRKPSMRPEEWVVALYSFSGEGEGDLSFREGDRIRIVKKTETDQDWWVGELNGSKGSFPANYCRSA